MALGAGQAKGWCQSLNYLQFLEQVPLQSGSVSELTLELPLWTWWRE